ncbi:MAG: PilZ domain-containing protein [Nitrospirae bacterium]|nr:PilZ domain-containing protein [Nitrospirota bacterium]
MGIENRRSTRYPLVGLASIEVLPEMNVIEGYVANFGPEGLGLYVRDPLNKGDHVHITLQVDGVRNVEVKERYQGNVAWVNRVGGVYAAGIQFVDEKSGCAYLGVSLG